jgi:phage recombination protein Bet
MSNEIIKTDSTLYDNEIYINTIKNQVAKGATNEELHMFLHLAKKYDLDPLAKEIWFIKRAKKVKDQKGVWDYKRTSKGEIDYTNAETMIMTSRDGYLSTAQKSGKLSGIMSMAIREGDVFEIDVENYKVIHKFGTKRGKILGAWAKVDHKDKNPVISYAEFSEYYDDKSTTWKKYPSSMIVKVAEAFALKRQFGISGLVTKEEIGMKEFESDNKIFEMLDNKQEKKELHDIIFNLIDKNNIEEANVQKVLKRSYQVENVVDLSIEESTEFLNRLKLLEENTVEKEKEAV